MKSYIKNDLLYVAGQPQPFEKSKFTKLNIIISEVGISKSYDASSNPAIKRIVFGEGRVFNGKLGVVGRNETSQSIEECSLSIRTNEHLDKSLNALLKYYPPIEEAWKTYDGNPSEAAFTLQCAITTEVMDLIENELNKNANLQILLTIDPAELWVSQSSQSSNTWYLGPEDLEPSHHAIGKITNVSFR